ncbi:hypothetical protein [Streptomyces griseorubiginosus]|uniref:hypothetical protein n=1 Tax=Streptomyces griseorubiginosus TaxID=67304 RepID=UPI00364FA3CF
MNADVLRAAYVAFAAVVRPLGDEESWRPTGCTGWAVRDLVTDLPEAPGPAAEGLAAVRATLDGLLGRPLPLDRSDEHYARAATGRAPLTDADRRVLGADADRFPLFS